MTNKIQKEALEAQLAHVEKRLRPLLKIQGDGCDDDEGAVMDVERQYEAQTQLLVWLYWTKEDVDFKLTLEEIQAV